jgi:hypothetical protein
MATLRSVLNGRPGTLMLPVPRLGEHNAPVRAEIIPGPNREDAQKR